MIIRIFSFLKRHKPQDEIPEPEGVRERALKIFSKIEGLDDIKEMMLRALESPERAHTLYTYIHSFCKIIIHARNRKIHAIKSILCRRSCYHKSRNSKIHCRKSG